MTRVDVLVQRLDPDLPLPAYEHPGDAGLDLRSRIDIVLEPGARALIPTGIAVALPSGYAAFVHPRSGLALRHGLGLVNGPGTIDAGYRGEIGVIVINHDPTTAITLNRGDRIAQLVVAPVVTASLVEVVDLPGSHRASGGFGSTGGFIGTVLQ
ncbi:MAG: dUTP diphosphatase [Actinobacteria bacterium]|uniref:dUTP diphosphatase n=1 Tax=freshwater metagenome TaxID=449393 RepID=A0A6J7EGJ8_9ZZZZ|nr:dUTP diphosphatase [Actinomycetota bacterium]